MGSSNTLAESNTFRDLTCSSGFPPQAVTQSIHDGRNTENNEMEVVVGFVTSYPINVCVKDSIYNECNLHLLASIDYVFGQTTNVIHCLEKKIDKYNIIFFIGVMVKVVTHLV